MKCRPSVKRQCPKCKIVRRPKGQGRKGSRVMYVICENPRHKMRQG